MSEAITVSCPNCKASLKLKSSSAVGKRVPCPKCKKPFVVKAPAQEEDDEMSFLNASESDGAMAVSEEDEETEAAEAEARESTSRSAGSKKKKKGKGKSAAPVNWLKPLLIGLATVAVIGMLVGGGMYAVTFIGEMSKNKIDLTYLPPDADLIVHIRVDEMLASLQLQPVVAKPEFKAAIDKLTTEFHVPLGDIKSVTVGLSGMGDVNFSKMMPIPGMGMPGMAGSPAAFSQVRRVIVIRASQPLAPDLLTKIPGYESATHLSATYYRPAAAQLRTTQPAVYLAAPDVLLVADETEIHRIAEKGSKQTRRSEFDFIEPGSQILVAMLNKSSATTEPAAGGPGAATPGGGMPGGGMPGGGMPGMPGGGMPGAGGTGMGSGAGNATGLASLKNAPSLTGGKIKGWYVGISLTQDIEIRTGLNCPDSAKDALADFDREIAKEKSEFASKNAHLSLTLGTLGLTDLIPHLESLTNSLSATATGSVVQVTAKIPGGIVATIEKAVPTIMGLAGANPGAMGNPIGAQPPTDGPPDDGGEAPTGDAEPSSSSQNPPASP